MDVTKCSLHLVHHKVKLDEDKWRLFEALKTLKEDINVNNDGKFFQINHCISNLTEEWKQVHLIISSLEDS